MPGVASKDSRNSAVATRQAEMQFYRLVLGVLAVWGITHLLHAEDGPWDLVVHLRRSAGDGFWGKLLDCFYCLSCLWVAAPVGIMLGSTWWKRALLWPSLSAGGCLLQRINEPARGRPAGRNLPKTRLDENNHGARKASPRISVAADRLPIP